MDSDGQLDVLLVQSYGAADTLHALYRQTPSGTFEDVSKSADLRSHGCGMGVAAGDVNNDGRG